VYQALRQAIMRCQLAPGRRLVIDDIARDLKVSAIPVREALQMLQSEGLVINVPHAGATVAPISRESVEEVFLVLEGLELAAARYATARVGESDRTGIVDLVGQMDRALRTGSPERWAALNSRFHLEISRICGMPLLVEMTERALARWDRVRRHFFKRVLVPRAREAQREHHAIVRSLFSRDASALERLLREHNQGALRAYAQHLRRTAPGDGSRGGGARPRRLPRRS
jgi:DNA-binding GntR family transcriptional regulator